MTMIGKDSAALESWLKRASYRLSTASAAQVRSEIREHYESACEEAIAVGADPNEQKQGSVGDPCALVDSRPLLPSEDAINESDDQQAKRNPIRIIGFIMGATVFCVSFLFGMKSAERVESRGLCGLKVPKWNRWLWLMRLSCWGLFVGGFLMFMWPRLI